jgi:uncharacterized membrane protein
LLVAFISKTMFVIWAILLVIYALAVGIDAALQYKSLSLGVMSIYASFIMLCGYGLGMIRAIFMRMILKSGKESEKPEITKT